MSDKKLIMVDASSLKHSGCILDLYRTLIEGYRSPVNSSDIEFGSAFHLYRSEVELTGDSTMSLLKAIKYFKDTPKYVKKNKDFLDEKYLMSTCEAYDMNYAADYYRILRNPADNKPLVEQKFALPYYADSEIEILLCGTIDRIVHNTINDSYCIADYKTSGIAPYKIQEYLESYALSSQLMFYTYALRKFGQHFPDSLIAQILQKPLGCFIDGVFLAKDKVPTFERSRVFYYSDEQMEEFARGLGRTIEKIIKMVKEGKESLWREGMITGACDKVWGKCGYWEVCVEEREDAREMLLENNYKKVDYNPLTFGGNEVK